MKKQDLKLMRWDSDGFPPIDLNASVKDVLALINEIKILRREMNRLKRRKA